MNRTCHIAFVLLVASAIIAGCGSTDGATPKTKSGAPSTTATGRSDATAPPPQSTVATAAPTTGPEPANTHPAITAALGFWTRYIDMTGRPGPFDPTTTRAELDEFTTGPETSKLFEFIQGNMLTGHVLRGTVDHSPRLDAATDETATVIDCLVDRTGIYSADGTRADAEELRPHPATLGLRVVAGVWKVETVSIGTEVCKP